mmetsp:Transcript_16617/g.51021  ORF Transcript_16617/g.51021 Transcript_16617/m.51021 type:complete len:219 (+) Transcript_16617:107-763(+)
MRRPAAPWCAPRRAAETRAPVAPRTPQQDISVGISFPKDILRETTKTKKGGHHDWQGTAPRGAAAGGVGDDGGVHAPGGPDPYPRRDAHGGVVRARVHRGAGAGHGEQLRHDPGHQGAHGRGARGAAGQGRHQVCGRADGGLPPHGGEEPPAGQAQPRRGHRERRRHRRAPRGGGRRYVPGHRLGCSLPRPRHRQAEEPAHAPVPRPPHPRQGRTGWR